jgi:hypothetical protein
MARNLPPGATLGADKGYDTAGFVAGLRALGVTPHVAQNTTHRRSAIDWWKEIFGWVKTIALLRKTVCNLVRMRTLTWRPAAG